MDILHMRLQIRPPLDTASVPLLPLQGNRTFLRQHKKPRSRCRHVCDTALTLPLWCLQAEAPLPAVSPMTDAVMEANLNGKEPPVQPEADTAEMAPSAKASMQAGPPAQRSNP